MSGHAAPGTALPLARAEAVAGTLPPLLVAAERVASTVAQGVHGRRRVGQGDSFWQYRPFSAGDAASRIDWRQSARGERLFVRETEWEAAQTVCLWRATGPVMDWHSHLTPTTKQARADLLLLALAVLLLRGGEQVRLIAPGLPRFAGRAGLLRLAATLAEPTRPSTLPPEADLPRHARVVLIGDLLDTLDDIETTVARLAAIPVRGLLLQVLDPAELDLPYDGRVRFDAASSGASTILPRVASVRERYAARLAAQRDGIGQLCRAAGFTFQTHDTHGTPEHALLRLYTALSPQPGGQR